MRWCPYFSFDPPIFYSMLENLKLLYFTNVKVKGQIPKERLGNFRLDWGNLGQVLLSASLSCIIFIFEENTLIGNSKFRYDFTLSTALREPTALRFQ